MAVVDGLADRLRQPAYTGANRCVPCTVVNVAIAVVLAEVLVVIAWPAGSLPALTVGGLALGGFLLTIYFRGYLVPGTPQLTKRYLPDRVLAWFDKAPARDGSPVQGTEDTESVDVEGTLVRAGALEECADADDLCLTDAFREEWFGAMDELGDSDAIRRTTVARLHDVEETTIEVTTAGDARQVEYEGRVVGFWPSAAAQLADLGAAQVLAERFEGWEDLAPPVRGEVVSGLRLFLSTCPDCGGEVAFGEEVVESCCRSIQVVSVSCQDCDARILELEHPEQ